MEFLLGGQILHRLLNVYQFRMNVHHVGGFQLLRVADSSRGRFLDLPGNRISEEERIRDSNIGAGLIPDAGGGNLQGRQVGHAVTVDDDEPLEAVINQAAQNFIEHQDQGLRGDGDGPRIRHVVGGPSVPAGRGHDRFGDPGGIFRQSNGHQGVVAQGKVQAVISEMIGQARLALYMMKKKRLHLGVDRVKARSEVQALYEKAKGR